jgi:hypothetical protein
VTGGAFKLVTWDHNFRANGTYEAFSKKYFDFNIYEKSAVWTGCAGQPRVLDPIETQTPEITALCSAFAGRLKAYDLIRSIKGNMQGQC